jgi:hypothetical protein
MLIREATNWPPQFGGAIQLGRDIPKFGDGTLYSVCPENNCVITFTGKVGDQEDRRHLKADTAQLAEKITEALLQNVGKRLGALGDLDISATMATAAR